MSEPSGKLWLGLHAEEWGRDLTGRYQYYHVRLVPIRMYESGHCRGITWDSFPRNNDEGRLQALAGLRIECQGSADYESRHNGVYGWDVAYNDVGLIDVRRAKAMAKALEQVERGMHKLDVEWGRPTSFGQYALRAAKALGARELVITPRNERFRGYDDTDLHRKTLADGAETIDWWINLWQQEGAAHVATANT